MRRRGQRSEEKEGTPLEMGRRGGGGGGGEEEEGYLLYLLERGLAGGPELPIVGLLGVPGGGAL